MCLTHSHTHTHTHPNISLSSTLLRWRLHFFSKDFCICNLIHIYFSLKAPKCTCQMERTKKIYWLHIKLLAHYDSSICVHCFVCFDMLVFFLFFVFVCFKPTGWVGLLDRLCNKQLTHMSSTSTSKYCNMSSKPERAYPTP